MTTAMGSVAVAPCEYLIDVGCAMNRIDNFSMNQMGLGPARARWPPRRALWRGEALTPKDEVSAPADAAEEISMHHSEKAEAKHFAERKVQAEGVARCCPRSR